LEPRIKIDYNQIVKLIHQLPKTEIERLANSLQAELSTPQSSEAIMELILNAPTWTDSEFDDYNQARAHVNKSRIA